MAQTRPLNRAPSAPPGRDFVSILFEDDTVVGDVAEPPFFRDLNLDQVVATVVSGRDEYGLAPFFHAPLRSVASVEYRHDVCRDLEQDAVRAAVRVFAGEMQRTRRFLGLAAKQHYPRERRRWFVDAAHLYCDAVSSLTHALVDADVRSRGFLGLRRYLTDHTAADAFASLAADAASVLEGLERVEYTLRIKEGRVTVSTYEGEHDHSVEVERDFERFRQGEVERHRFKLPDPGSMDHVEARIAELVARLYPDEFRALDEFCARHRDFLDPTIARFDREVQFYLAYLELRDRLAAGGLPFCYPTVSTESKEEAAEDAFDVALAAKLAGERRRVVPNDFVLGGAERVLVVTGPNQGGKTTFARMFGQLHYLGSLGLPVPAREARLFLPDRLFTHFEREEDIATLRGKLEDELVRVREILDEATGDSVVIVNELFSSTSLRDAIHLGIEVLRQVVDLGALAVCVTFVDELASLSEATVSMVANVAPDDPAQRTYKVVRRPADGRAYAWAIAEKYGLGRETLKGRLSR
jgi:DNA mismatch repair protein MutS